MKLHDVDTERLVIAAILADEQVFWSVSGQLREETFTDPDVKAIYMAIVHMVQQSSRISRQILSYRLQGKLSAGQDAKPFLAALYAQGKADGDPALAVDHVDALVEMEIRRAGQTALEKAVAGLANIDNDPEQVLAEVSDVAAALCRQSDYGSRSTLAQAVRGVIDLASDAAQVGGLGYQIPLAGLDDMSGRLLPGDLVLLGGGPGSGKTALALQLSAHLAAQHSVEFFELEMANLKLVQRWIAGQADVSVRHMNAGMSPKEFDQLAEFGSSYDNHHMNLWDRKFTMGEIRARALAQKRRHGLDILVVDHINLIKRDGRERMSLHERAYANAEDLKEMAKSLGCVVLALCHFTKMGRDKDTPDPEMEDFFGGGLEAHADLMWANLNRNAWLQRHPPVIKTKLDKWYADLEETKGKIEVFKLKDRSGEARGHCAFTWDGPRQMFIDPVVPEEELPF